MILLLLACGPRGTGACEPDLRSRAPSLAVTTADPQFGAGSMTVGDAEGLDEARFGTGGDAIVRVADGRLYVVERGQANAIAAFDPLDARCPLWQTDLGTNTNAHDVVALDDRLYVPLYDAGEIAVLSVDGELLDPIQVPGELPALDRAVVAGGALWVADQRFDRTAWASSEGVLLEIREGAITEHPAGTNPRLVPGRTPDELLIADGLLALNASQADRVGDGSLRAFDTATASWSGPLVTEQALSGDIHAVAAVQEHVVLAVTDAHARSRVHCIGVGDGPSDAGWFSAVVPYEDHAVVSVRSGPGGVGERGLWLIDPLTCQRTGHLPVEGTEPYDVASF